MVMFLRGQTPLGSTFMGSIKTRATAPLALVNWSLHSIRRFRLVVQCTEGSHIWGIETGRTTTHEGSHESGYEVGATMSGSIAPSGGPSGKYAAKDATKTSSTPLTVSIFSGLVKSTDDPAAPSVSHHVLVQWA